MGRLHSVTEVGRLLDSVRAGGRVGADGCRHGVGFARQRIAQFTNQRIFLQAGLARDHDLVAHVEPIGGFDVHLVGVEW